MLYSDLCQLANKKCPEMLCLKQTLDIFLSSEMLGISRIPIIRGAFSVITGTMHISIIYIFWRGSPLFCLRGFALVENDISIVCQYCVKLLVMGWCGIGKCNFTCIVETLIRIMFAQLENKQCCIITLFFSLHILKNAFYNLAGIRPDRCCHEHIWKPCSFLTW